MKTNTPDNSTIIAKLMQLTGNKVGSEQKLVASLLQEINMLKTDLVNNNLSSLSELQLLEKLFCKKNNETQEQKELILKLKLRNKELKIAKERAEQSDKLKSEFLNNISHEIRTPLNGVIGFSDILKRKKIDKAKQFEFLHIIHKSSLQLLEIFNDLLEISKLDTKKVKFDKNKVCLNSLLNELTKKFKSEIKEKNLKLIFKPGLKNCLCVIYTDFAKLNNAIKKILNNAIKFTHSGVIELGYFTKNESIIIYIKDSGIGIKTELVPEIFKIFSQGNKGLNRSYGGLGMGLTIAQENIKQIGGVLDFKSIEGKGTTFYIKIPYLPADTIC